ncbi:hypothetical protein [Flavobacterium plurextorum]|nr:hypothetical protein [Flavobacterium plurextorum]
MSLLIDREWATFASTQLKKNREEADKVSYFIDNLVRDDILENNTLKKLPADKVTVAKKLLSFSRLKRRSIAARYFNFKDHFKGFKGSTLPSNFMEIDGVGILFLYYPGDTDLERLHLLKEYTILCCFIQKKIPITSLILLSSNRREEIELVYREKFTELSSKEKALIKLIEDNRAYSKQKIIFVSEDEFPMQKLTFLILQGIINVEVQIRYKFYKTKSYKNIIGNVSYNLLNNQVLKRTFNLVVKTKI